MGMMMVPTSKRVAPPLAHGQSPPEALTSVQEWLQHLSAPGQGAVRLSQVVGGGGGVGVTQAPLTQFCPAAHGLQPPQWAGSLCVSMQALAQQDWPVAQPTALQLVSGGGGGSSPLPVSRTVSSGVSGAVSFRVRGCSNCCPAAGAKTTSSVRGVEGSMVVGAAEMEKGGAASAPTSSKALSESLAILSGMRRWLPTCTSPKASCDGPLPLEPRP